MGDRETTNRETRPRDGALPNSVERLQGNIPRLSLPRVPSRPKTTQVRKTVKVDSLATGFDAIDGLACPPAIPLSLTPRFKFQGESIEHALENEHHAEFQSMLLSCDKFFNLDVDRGRVKVNASFNDLNGEWQKDLSRDGQNFLLRYNPELSPGSRAKTWFSSDNEFLNPRAGAELPIGESWLVKASSRTDELLGRASIQYKNRFYAECSNFDPENPQFFSVIDTNNIQLGARVQEGLFSFGGNIRNETQDILLSARYIHNRDRYDVVGFSFITPDYAVSADYSPELSQVTAASMSVDAHKFKNGGVLSLGAEFSSLGREEKTEFRQLFSRRDVFGIGSLQAGAVETLFENSRPSYGFTLTFEAKR